MAVRSPQNGRATVLVRLSDVPEPTRLDAALVLIKRDGLEGLEAADMLGAAIAPVDDPSLAVTWDEYRRVMR